MWETPWSAAIMATNCPVVVVCGDTATSRGRSGRRPWFAKAQNLSQAFRFDLSAAKA